MFDLKALEKQEKEKKVKEENKLKILQEKIKKYNGIQNKIELLYVNFTPLPLWKNYIILNLKKINCFNCIFHIN